MLMRHKLKARIILSQMHLIIVIRLKIYNKLIKIL
jgi:hypothetical protein